MFQDLNLNPTKDWGSCQEVSSCRSQVLWGQTQPLTPAQPQVHQASLPKSTAYRFMVHESRHICDIWWAKPDDEEPLINTKICWVPYPIQFAPSDLDFLIAVRPSIKHSKGVSDDVAVTKGGDVSLQCAAEGVPRPAVTWLKDGRPISGQHRAKILNEGRLLQIKNVKVSDTGRYTCVAVNTAGQADSRHDISVHGMGYVPIIAVFARPDFSIIF